MKKATKKLPVLENEEESPNRRRGRHLPFKSNKVNYNGLLLPILSEKDDFESSQKSESVSSESNPIVMR